MACLWVAETKSWVKGHHHYNFKYTIDKNLNAWKSQNTSTVNMSFQFTQRNQRMKIVGHTPDALAKVVDGLVSEWMEDSSSDGQN